MNAHDDRLSTLVGCIHGLVLEFDERGAYVNAWTDEPALLARPVHELIGKTIGEVLGTAGRPFSEVVRRVFETGKMESIEYSLPVQGGLRWFLADVKRVTVGPAVQHVVFFARDITDRKQSEEALRRSEERYRRIARATSDVFYEWYFASGEVVWTGALETVFGHRSTSTPLDWWAERLHPADREQTLRSVHHFIEARDPGTWRGEYRFLRGDGTYADVEDKGCSMFDEDGRPTSLVGAMTDLSVTKRLQQQLLHADRLVAIGTLSAGVAHEINNPLAFILSNTQFACEELEGVKNALQTAMPQRPDDAETVRSLAEVIDALGDLRNGADRVSVIVRDLKDFCRFDESKSEAVDVRKVLDHAITMASPELRHLAQVTKDYREVPQVEANTAKLGQVFLNLLINAVHAMAATDVQQNVLRVTTRTDASGEVVIEVADTGCGMSAEVMARVFDPFFTTKPVGRGSGLGLSICHGIVTALGGRIQVDSAPGMGSCFRVCLPPAGAPKTAPTSRLAAVPPRRGRLLILDDEPLVGSGLKRLLAKEHEVEVLTCARKALEGIAGGKRYDVILCDLMMPGVTGMDFYDRLVATHLSQAERIVFLSGGAVTERSREFAARMGDRMLSKATAIDSLKTLVRDHLEKHVAATA